MKYADLNGKKLVALEPGNFGKPLKELFELTDVSGSDLFRVYSSNNFRNPLAKADKKLFEKMGYFDEVLRDYVIKDRQGRGDIVYVSNAGTEHEHEPQLLARPDILDVDGAAVLLVSLAHFQSAPWSILSPYAWCS